LLSEFRKEKGGREIFVLVQVTYQSCQEKGWNSLEGIYAELFFIKELISKGMP